MTIYPKLYNNFYDQQAEKEVLDFEKNNQWRGKKKYIINDIERNRRKNDVNFILCVLFFL